MYQDIYNWICPKKKRFIIHYVKPTAQLLFKSHYGKQIVAILHYGAAIWSVSKTNDCIYLNYNNGAETRNIVIEALHDARGNEIPYVFARKVGIFPIDNSTNNRRILVKL